MSDRQWKWNTDAFDAIRITAPQGEIEIVGTDDTQVELEGAIHSGWNRAEPTIRGRWLIIQSSHSDSELSLTLPRSKTWVVEVSAAHGEVNVENINARLSVQLGHGEIRVKDCRGTFDVNCGSGEVRLEHCFQIDTPAAPDFSYEPRAGQPAGVPPVPPVPPIPGMGAIPPIPPIPPIPGFGGASRKTRFSSEADWEEYGAQWEEWGNRFAEQATRWADKFARDFTGGMERDDKPDAPGFHLRLGHGDVELEDIEANYVSVRLGNGDVMLEEGRVGELDLESSHGELRVENILPVAEWNLTTRHGDIQLVLPADTRARIDAATRHGDIESDIPLVSVGRPGRAARHGGRMVGTQGAAPAEGQAPIEIHIETLQGDIEIQLSKQASKYGEQHLRDALVNTSRAETARTPQTSSQPVTANPAAVQTTGGAVVPVTITDLPPAGADAALNPPPTNKMQVYNSQLAILQALQTGEITVAEAEMLLRNLHS